MARDTRPSDVHFSDIRKRRHQTRQRQLRRAWLQIMICGASLTASQSVLAEVPTGGNVVAGAATFAPGANSLDITATTSRSIVDWNSFNIGAGNTVNFNLPDASSSILNRVTTPNMPSAIHGMLQSNGNVYLVNPSGIVVGSTGTINTNTFVASTLDITNQNFLSGGALQFSDSGNAASIINHGTINTGDGGAHLIAGSITNHGSITSTGGNITLSGGGTVTLNNGVTYVQPRLDVLASGISPTAGLIQNTGSIRATGAATSGGEVYLVNPSGTILHDGTIAAHREPQALASGPSAEQNTTIGGHVQLEAGHITLASNSHIDASGTHGGGRVLVGGDWQGSGPMHQPTRVTMESGAIVDASATVSGDGGRIVLWSDIWNNESVTEVFGTLLSTGGSLSGNGGEIETSGHLLQIGPEAYASTRAANGQTGQWLLDPINFTIGAGNGVQTTSGIGANTLANALANNNVTIQTDAATSGAGDININAAISSNSDTSLTLLAHNNINIGADIFVGGGIRLIASGDITGTNAIRVTTSGGDAFFISDSDGNEAGSIDFRHGIRVLTNGGEIKFTGGDLQGGGYAVGGHRLRAVGVRFGGETTIDSSGGSITIRGKSWGGAETSAYGAYGVGWLSGEISISSGHGTITIDGVGQHQGTNQQSHGVYLNTVTTIHSTNPTENAIRLMGDSSLVNVLNANANGISLRNLAAEVLIVATGDGGGVTMMAKGTGSQPDLFNRSPLKILADSGPIHIHLAGGSSLVNHSTATLTLGSNIDSIVPHSTSDIALYGNYPSGLFQKSSIATTGRLSLLPLSESFAESLNWSSFNSSFPTDLGGLTIGKPGNQSSITLSGAFIVGGDVELYGGDIVFDDQLASTGKIKIDSVGAVSSTLNGHVIAEELSLTGGGNFTLTNASNSVGNLAFDGNNLSFVNQSELTIAAIGSIDGINAKGTVDVSTLEGDLVVTAKVITTNAMDDAITLNAARGRPAGDAEGGDIKLVGAPEINTGAGGRATLYTGSVSDSSGVSQAVGLGSGRFRYSSDESETHFSLGLAEGLHAIYRQQPTLTADSNALSVVYGESPTVGMIFNSLHGDTPEQIFQVFPSLSLSDGALSSSGNFAVGYHDFDLLGGLEQLGYQVSPTVSGRLTVTPRPILLSEIRGIDKIYDSTLNVSLDTSAVVFSGAMLGDHLSVGPIFGLFADKNVGTAKSIHVSAALSGADAGNYVIAGLANATAEIFPRPIELYGITADNKIYDGTTAVSVDVGNIVLSGLLAGDNLTVASQGTFADKNVGTTKQVFLNNVFGGADVGNYLITDQTSATADIMPRELSVSGIFSSNKAYDGSTDALINLSEINFAGLISGDDLTVASQGTFADKNVGTAKQVFLSNLFGGADVGNYLITDQTGTTADITPRPITIGGITAIDKIYDGTTVAIVDTSNVDLTGLIAGDDLTIFSQGVFADKNVGSNKQVLLNNIFSGTDQANYFINDQKLAYANIDPKELAVSGLLALSKVYDATTTATIDYSNALLSGLISGDDVSIASVTGSFADKNVGEGKSVATNTLLSGVDATSYAITNHPATTASITAAPLTLAGIEAASKVYDGNATATIIGTPSISPFFGDNVSINGTATATFDTKHVGTGKSVLVGGFTLSGADAGNYALQLPTSITASITPAPLTITARNDSKLVTLQDSVGFAGIDYSGFVAGEDESVLSGTLSITRTIAGEHAGQYQQSLLPSGVTAENYDIQFTAGDFAIRPADALRIRFADSSSIYGDSPAFAPIVAEYLVDGEAFHTLDAYLLPGNRFAFIDAVGEQTGLSIAPLSPRFSSSGYLRVGEYALGADNLSMISSNFDNQLIVIGSHSVTTAPIDIIAGGLSKVYDGNTSIPHMLLGTSGLRGSDNVSVIGSGHFLSRNAGNSVGYRLTDLSLLGADAENYFLESGATHLGTGGVITPKPVSLTAPTVSRIFDGGIVAIPTRDQLESLTPALGVAGDTVQSIQLRFDTPHVGTGKRLTPSMAIIADGNGGRNYALSYAPSFTSRIEEAAQGSVVTVTAGGFDTKLEITSRQSVTDTNTRYTSGSPIAPAPINLAKPMPAVEKSIQTSGNATGPAVSVIVTRDAVQEGGETFIGAPDQEVERKKTE